MPLSVVKSVRRRRRRVKSKVKKISSQVARLSKAVAGEQRFISSAQANGTAITTAGTFLLMNGCTTGSGDGAREGTKIVINRIAGKGLAYVNSSVTTNSATGIRLMLVLDRQPNGAIFSIADLLDNAGNNQNNVYSLQRFNFRNRFRVLMDKTRCIKPSANTRQAVALGTYEAGDWCFQFAKRFKKGITVEYNTGTAGTVADIAKNSLYLLAIADNSTESFIWCRCHVYYTP